MIHAPLPRIRILVETEESWPPARPSSEVLSPSSTWEALVPAQAEPPNTPDDFATWYMQQQFAEENKTRARLSRRQSFIPSPRNMQNAQLAEPLPPPPFIPPPPPAPEWHVPGKRVEATTLKLKAVSQRLAHVFKTPKSFFPGKAQRKRKSKRASSKPLVS
ncbi:hypothetical protein NLI96_g5354 [Meripilus lineatus]|uniref:Uncharacterized protein n=1 Tax=Meripilus lineatus TaxID=2056292 RepID=A0AAD5V2X1_9APHY|nr:hypothetical protein NLI96_g5354 [Physisporinus lineatus]